MSCVLVPERSEKCHANTEGARLAPFHYLVPVTLVLKFISAIKTHLVSGRPGYSSRFVRSTGKDGKVRRKALLGLGTDFSLPRSLRPDVTGLNGDTLSGQTPPLGAEP